MKVKDVMTTEVLTIAPQASLKEVAALLVEHRISGLPVCSAEGQVLGVVSEGDILFKQHETKRGRGGPLAWIGATDTEARIAKAQALTVGEAMSTPAITIRPTQSVAEAARLMCEHHVNRLPVVREDQLVGIVTRADLVRAFTRTDREIEREIREDVLERTLWANTNAVEIDVLHGAVTLKGTLETEGDAALLTRLAGLVPGVVSVHSELDWQWDDAARRSMRTMERTL